MSNPESKDLQKSTFFDMLGSVDQDLMVQVLNDAVEAASESGLRPLRYAAHQLRKEVERERLKYGSILDQMRVVDRLLNKLRPVEETSDSETLALIAVLHARSEDLQGRMSESCLREKEDRFDNLKKTMVGIKLRSKVATTFLEKMRSERAGRPVDGPGLTVP